MLMPSRAAERVFLYWVSAMEVIAEMIEAAGIGLGAAITGTRGSIPPVTGEGNETRAGRAAMAANPAVLVIVAFQREGTLM